MLEAIDRYKFGILAAFGVYIAIFMWSQFDTFESYFDIVPFTKTGSIQTEDELTLTPENIDVTDAYAQDVLNMANNVSDGRETSDDNFYENQTPAQAAANIKELERQMQNDAGGAEERKRLAGLIAERKAQQQDLIDRQHSEPTPTANQGGNKKYAGQTMVSFDLSGRDAYQNNKWFVRNPGYTCDNSSRVKVVIDIKVGNDGYVSSAVYNSSKSSGASGCEIDAALRYAKKSRFEYKASGGSESGWISYTFMPK